MSELDPMLVTVDRVTDLIGKCRRSVYQLIATDKLEAVKSGRNTLVVYDSVKRYVDSLPPARFSSTPARLSGSVPKTPSGTAKS
jgi:hypothetical protein